MGCANSKTGATGACGEEAGGAAPPKVMVDGEGQDGAANGNAVSCANGTEEQGDGKEACNGDVSAKNDESDAAPSGGEKTEQNGGSEEGAEKSIQDGGAEDNNEEQAASTDEAAAASNEDSTAADSENAESRENSEEKAE